MDKCPQCGLPTKMVCPNQDCPVEWNREPGGITYLPAKQPYVLSEAFLLCAIFVMTLFNFSIMLIFFLAGLFGGT